MARPDLSFVLPTDSWETAAETVSALEQQSVAPAIELVVVTPDPNSLRAELARARLGGVRAVPGDLSDVPAAHASGVSAASAPIVFLGETHAFPEPDALRCVLEAFTDVGVACVVPRLVNANPALAVSWVEFLLAYGPWTVDEARDLERAASFNVAFRRAELLDLGVPIAGVLRPGGGVDARLRDRGRRLRSEPGAVLRHVNITRARPALDLRFHSARAYAAVRSGAWSRGRRVLYAAAAPAIAGVLVRRTWRGEAWLAAGVPPRRALGTLLVFAGVSAAGEAVGYVAGAGRARARASAYEVHRADYV